jgi:hypothetical protein
MKPAISGLYGGNDSIGSLFGIEPQSFQGSSDTEVPSLAKAMATYAPQGNVTVPYNTLVGWNPQQQYTSQFGADPFANSAFNSYSGTGEGISGLTPPQAVNWNNQPQAYDAGANDNKSFFDVSRPWLEKGAGYLWDSLGLPGMSDILSGAGNALTGGSEALGGLGNTLGGIADWFGSVGVVTPFMNLGGLFGSLFGGGDENLPYVPSQVPEISSYYGGWPLPSNLFPAQYQLPPSAIDYLADVYRSNPGLASQLQFIDTGDLIDPLPTGDIWNTVMSQYGGPTPYEQANWGKALNAAIGGNSSLIDKAWKDYMSSHDLYGDKLSWGNYPVDYYVGPSNEFQADWHLNPAPIETNWPGGYGQGSWYTPEYGWQMVNGQPVWFKPGLDQASIDKYIQQIKAPKSTSSDYLSTWAGFQGG